MLVKGFRKELAEYVYPVKTRIQAITYRDIDKAVFAQ
jgi:hypothetical protein